MHETSSRRFIRRTALAGALLTGALFDSGALSATAAGAAQQPARISSTTQIDNERVSVRRLTFPVGAREQMHITPQDLVVIQATAGDVEVSLGSETTKGRVEPGKVWYVSKTTEHAYSNTGREPFDLLVVFLK
jgi:quercetin dioxygenase-like cupin family protein